MKQWFMLSGLMLFLALFAADAQAICQKCNNPYTENAMCWTISACDQTATMSACVVVGTGARTHCDSMGTGPGAECNGNASYCNGSGGGGGGGGFGGGGCTIDYGEACPADCSGCQYRDGLPPEYNG